MRELRELKSGRGRPTGGRSGRREPRRTRAQRAQPAVSTRSGSRLKKPRPQGGKPLCPERGGEGDKRAPRRRAPRNRAGGGGPASGGPVPPRARRARSKGVHGVMTKGGGAESGSPRTRSRPRGARSGQARTADYPRAPEPLLCGGGLVFYLAQRQTRKPPPISDGTPKPHGAQSNSGNSTTMAVDD